MSGFDEQERLSQELHQRSHDVGGHPIGLDAVKGSARRIHRRRVAGGAVVAAAVLAVAVPTGFALTGTSTNGTGPVAQGTASATTSASPTESASESASPSPSTTPEPSQSPTAGPGLVGAVPLTAQGAPAGPGPVIDYLQGKEVHSGGTVTQLPAAYTDLTPFHGGWLAASFDQGDTFVVELDGTNRVVSTTAGSDRFALSADGTMVSWFTTPGRDKDGRLWSAISNGMGEVRDSTVIPAGTQVKPVGWAGGVVVYEAYATDPQVWTTDFAGHTHQIEGLLAATGTSQVDGVVAGQTSSTDTGSCWTVMAVDSGKHLWDTCDYALGQFSPDGRYVLGTDAYADGLGGRTVALLDAHTGKAVVRYQAAGNGDSFTGDSVWEDDSHVLTMLYEGGAWHMLRLSPDGHLERAAGPVPGSPESRPWRFTARP